MHRLPQMCNNELNCVTADRCDAGFLRTSMQRSGKVTRVQGTVCSNSQCSNGFLRKSLKLCGKAAFAQGAVQSSLQRGADFLRISMRHHGKATRAQETVRPSLQRGADLLSVPLKPHVQAARTREAIHDGCQCGTGLSRASSKPRGRNAIATYTVDGEPNDWCRHKGYNEDYKNGKPSESCRHMRYNEDYKNCDLKIRQVIYTTDVSDILSLFNLQIGAKPIFVELTGDIPETFKAIITGQPFAGLSSNMYTMHRHHTQSYTSKGDAHVDESTSTEAAIVQAFSMQLIDAKECIIPSEQQLHDATEGIATSSMQLPDATECVTSSSTHSIGNTQLLAGVTAVAPSYGMQPSADANATKMTDGTPIFRADLRAAAAAVFAGVTARVPAAGGRGHHTCSERLLAGHLACSTNFAFEQCL